MPAQSTELNKQSFNIGIMKTFGKMDADDIRAIDGNPERLVARLIDSYGWSRIDAQAQVDRFLKSVTPAVAVK